MAFELSKRKIKDHKIAFIYEKEAYSGVKKIADRVRSDMKAVFGTCPVAVEMKDFFDSAAFFPCPIFFGTVGNSPALSKLEEDNLFSPSAIIDKREVYSISVIEDFTYEGFFFDSALVIAGSDKRGTIYGLLKISELLGVSPFIDWLEVKPKKKSSYTFDYKKPFISKEPSVKYRGFFINDEWPAFGNFCEHNFGGFNAQMYENVFQLLLRLKGNYLWPAMWSAIFPNDGPYLKNAELADEYGVVMGTSHHEPCCRQGEEFKYLGGKDSIYGEGWNFRTNQRGITRFWKEGLIRSAGYEKVITMGMRGEYDSAIMDEDATLSDNVELLRDVLKTQNSLIRENVNENLEEVPRMFALYKEVEPFFYGDENTKGLMDDPELEGVTLLLCDDNYGNLRRMPTEAMKNHKGGYGMYYHFDYHGYPVSYEWFNTTYLPKVWEQMTTAYEFGIRDMWIVNVGDIFTNEYPLNFFLDMAYDFDKWGTSNLNSPAEYTSSFVKTNFGRWADEKDEKIIEKLLTGYTKIAAARRSEAMNEKVYAPIAYKESEELLEKIQKLAGAAKEIRKRLSEDDQLPFYEIVYLPLMGNLNVTKLWLLAAQNHRYAEFGSTYALSLAEKVNACIRRDRKLVKELHTIHNEKWYGMGMSEHIGFKHWCEEECQYPIVHTFEPANKSRLIVSLPGNSEHSEGGFWTGETLSIRDFMCPESTEAVIRLTTAGRKSIAFSAKSSSKHLTLSETSGSVKFGEAHDIIVSIDRDGFDSCIRDKEDCETVLIKTDDATVCIRVPVNNIKRSRGYYEKNTYIWNINDETNYISMDAEDYTSKHDTAAGGFKIIPEYGRTKSAVKVFPQNKTFSFGVDSPYLIYKFVLPKEGEYIMELYTNPSNPCYDKQEMMVGVYANNEASRRINLIPEGFGIGDGNEIWAKGVLDNIRITPVSMNFREGLNVLTISAISPGFVLEKIVIYKKDEEPLDSYLGPPKSFCL